MSNPDPNMVAKDVPTTPPPINPSTPAPPPSPTFEDLYEDIISDTASSSSSSLADVVIEVDDDGNFYLPAQVLGILLEQALKARERNGLGPNIVPFGHPPHMFVNVKFNFKASLFSSTF